MKERFTRLRTIRRIIKDNRIDSQETLLGYLEKEGYTVTQATLSRDLKLLHVGKISDGTNGYHYTLPGDDERKEPEQTYIQDFIRGFVSIDFSGNICVIRTISGHANSVAFALDNMNLVGVIGTVAGDDTIFVLLAEGLPAQEFLDMLKDKIPEIEI